MKLSVIIPAYKNKEMLLRNLNSNFPYIKDNQIVIIDDASGENIAESVQKKYPSILVITNDHNIGFGESVNTGVAKATGDYVMLLNNDVVLTDDSYKKAVTHLANNSDYFAVSFMQTEKNNSKVGKNSYFTRKGFIFNKKANDLSSGLNAWAEGGSTVINKKYFEQLGGFSPLFSPAYYEDIDLSYRAYKRGYKVLFDNEICVEHHHESTTGAVFSTEYKKTLSYRNHFIFMWKNITDLSLLLEHIFFLPYYFIKHFLILDRSFFTGLYQAMCRLPEIIKSRNVESNHIKLGDKVIIGQFE